MPLILVLQHSADDPPGRLGTWLVEAGCELRLVRCHLGEPLPQTLTGFDGLVVLGGGMGAYDDAEYPWLAPTKELLALATRRDLPTLAICLGHQLLSVANAGLVTQADVPQIGVVDLRLTAAAAGDPLFGPLTVPTREHSAPSAVHFNNDIVARPPDEAVVLSHSAAGLQAFRLGTNVWGVQFHPEVDVSTVAGWAAEEVATGRLDRSLADAAIAGISEADPELDATWRAFTHRFAVRVGRERVDLR